MAISFDSISDRLALSSPPVGTAFTWCGWFYMNTQRASSAGMIGVQNVDGTAWNTFEVRANGQVWLNDSVSGGFLQAGTWTVGVWTFFAVAHSAADTIIYRAVVGENTLTQYSGNNLASMATPTLFHIGCGRPAFSDYFDGYVAGIKVWSGSALTKVQLEAEMITWTPVVTSGIRAVYRMASTASMLTDTSGNGNNLTNPPGTGTWATQTDPVIGQIPAIAGGLSGNFSTLPGSVSRPVEINLAGGGANMATTLPPRPKNFCDGIN